MTSVEEDQRAHLVEAQKKLHKVEDKQSSLEERIDHATQLHNFLGQRLQQLRSLPVVHKRTPVQSRARIQVSA